MTVDECRRLERRFLKMNLPKYLGKDFTKENEKRMKKLLVEYAMYFVTGERFAKKEETIRKWEEEGKRKDEKLENTEFIEGIRCVECDSEMEHRIKELDDAHGKERVLLLYRCPNCKKGRVLYEDGSEWEHKAYCPKCKAQLDVDSKRKGNVSTYIEKCSQCGYEDTEEFNLDKKEKEETDENFAKDRERFCLSEEKGREYVDTKFQMKQIVDSTKEQKTKKKEEDKTKYVTIAQVEERLGKTLKKNGYVKLKFETPEVQKDLIVSFSVQDEKMGREEYDSRQGLKKLIQKTLQETNWTLMSDGVYYKLGFLSGRLRGKNDNET